MNELVRMCLIICPLVLCASFVDSVAGGGGLIAIPAYLLAGVPTYMKKTPFPNTLLVLFAS